MANVLPKGEWVLPLRSTPRLLKNMFREWNVGQMCSDARISYKNPSVIVKNRDTTSFIIVSKDCFMSSLSAWTGQRRRQLLRCSATLHWTAEHTDIILLHPRPTFTLWHHTGHTIRTILIIIEEQYNRNISSMQCLECKNSLLAADSSSICLHVIVF